MEQACHDHESSEWWGAEDSHRRQCSWEAWCRREDFVRYGPGTSEDGLNADEEGTPSGAGSLGSRPPMLQPEASSGQEERPDHERFDRSQHNEGTRGWDDGSTDWNDQYWNDQYWHDRESSEWWGAEDSHRRQCSWEAWCRLEDFVRHGPGTSEDGLNTDDPADGHTSC